MVRLLTVLERAVRAPFVAVQPAEKVGLPEARRILYALARRERVQERVVVDVRQRGGDLQISWEWNRLLWRLQGPELPVWQAR